MIPQQQGRKRPPRKHFVILSILLLFFILLVGATLITLGNLGIIPWSPSLNTIFVGTFLPVLGLIVALAQWLHSISSHKSESPFTSSPPHVLLPASSDSPSLVLTQPMTQQTFPAPPSASSITSEQQSDIPDSTLKPEPIWKVPSTFTPLLGREHDVATVRALLSRSEVRLLTLLGTGGVGKTRVALHIAADMRDAFPDGICFVPLAAINDPALVVPTIALELDIQEIGAQPIFERLKLFLRDRHFLLLLDNFEQVVTAAPQIEELLATGPSLKILVTSRAPLHIQGEQEYLVPPLTLPDLDHLPAYEALSHYAAIALFLQRARAVLPTFELTPGIARAVAEICVRLDGLPLAIELAAARIRVLPSQALLSRLSQRFQVLTSGGQTLPVRQQTLRNTIAWSYDLLEAQEQRLFRQLCVFIGGCSLQAAEAVCGTLSGGDGAPTVLDGVSSLVDKSLLQQTEQTGEEPRFVMLETIREYGLEALAASGEEEATRQAHATYYLRLAEEAARGISGPQQTTWLQRLERGHDNLRAALQWSLEQGESGQSTEMALRFSRALADFWNTRGYYSEGRMFLKRVFAGSNESLTSIRAEALNIAASLASAQGDFGEAEELSEESLALSRRLEDARGIGTSLSIQSHIAWAKDNPLVASSLLREALALYRELGDKKGIAKSLYNLGWQAKLRKRYTRARVFLEKSLVIYRELGDKGGIARTLFELAEVLFRAQGDSLTVRSRLEESRGLFEEAGDKEGTAWVLELLGKLAHNQGDTTTARSLLEDALGLYKEIGDQPAMVYLLLDWAFSIKAKGEFVWAAQLLGKAESMREGIGFLLSSVERTNYEQAVATLRAQLGEKSFASAWAEGRAMTPEQALAAK